MEVTALTLNCWGIVGVSKDRSTRFEAITLELKSTKYDFVFLQEVWSEFDYKFIAERVKSVFPFSHYFHSGVIGAGICIFSKSKIVNVFFHNWSLNGYIHNIHHGDWYGGKGVGLCTVDHHGIIINLYNAHLHAKYNNEDDEYQAHRLLQAFETSQFINYTRHGADLCILGGDLNTNPAELPYKIVQHNTRMIDTFLVTKKPDIEGMTSETPQNSYTAIESLRKFPDGQRIDYIMYLSKHNVSVETVDCYNPLPTRVENRLFSYSDHEAVCTTLRVTVNSSGDMNAKCEPQLEDSCFTESLQDSLVVFDISLEKLSRNRARYLWKFGFCLMLVLCLPLTNFILSAIHIMMILSAGYFCIMATAWNRIELHAIISAKLAVVTLLQRTVGTSNGE